MIFKGTHKIKYTLDRKSEELIVKVELKEREGILPMGKSVYYGVATVNGSVHDEEIDGCVNAQFYAEGLAEELIKEYKSKARDEGKSLRIKRK